MKIIKENVKNIYEIKKSKFITYLYKVNNLDEINNIVTVTITTEKEVFDANSESSYTFSYQVVER